MQLFFQNPSWMWLGLLALVPLLVHLVARARPRVMRYPSLRFLQQVIRKSSRWQKPKDWFVWFLRTLALLGVLLAILGPLLMRAGESPGSRKTLVVVLDRSASMAYEDRFGEAANQAVQALREQKPDLANVVWIDSAPRSFYREPGPAVAGIVEAVERAEVSAELGSPQAALALAASQLAELEGQRELLVISDFQKSAWEDLEWPVPAGVTVTRVQVGEGEGSNQALKALFVEPMEPVVGQKASLVCQVRNFSSEPVRVPVYANIEGVRSSREVEVAAWGEAEVIFPLAFEEAGEKLVQVRLGGDAFPADDWRALELPVRESLVLATQGPALVWPEVARALPWLTLQEEGEDAKEADFLWVGDWSGEENQELNELREGGPTLLLELGEGADSAAVANVVGGLLGVLDDSRRTTKAEGWKVRIAQEDAAIFALFRDGEYGSPFEGTFKQRMKYRPFGKTWAEYEDGVPALQFIAGSSEKSPIVIWNLPLASPASDWSQQPNFVPFLGELLLNTRPANKSRRSASLLAGSVLSWRPGLDGDGGTVQLGSGDEESLSVLRKKEEGVVFYQSESGAGPGVWNWQSGGREVARAVVNFPSDESDLRPLSNGSDGEIRTAEGFARQLALSSGWALWPWLVAAAFLFLLAESLLVLWRPKSSAQKGGQA